MPTGGPAELVHTDACLREARDLFKMVLFCLIPGGAQLSGMLPGMIQGRQRQAAASVCARSEEKSCNDDSKRTPEKNLEGKK